MIKNLLEQVWKYKLSAPESFWQTDVETLTGVYNGIGPEQWPRYLRGIVTDLLVLFAPAALVHDYEFSTNAKSYKHFTQANARLAWNCLLLALFGEPSFVENKLHSRLKIAALGLLLGVGCQLFGYNAYNN